MARASGMLRSSRTTRWARGSRAADRAVGAGLEGAGPLPPAAAKVPGLDVQLRQQDRAAQMLNRIRHAQGALEFESTDVRHVFDGETLRELRPEKPNRAKDLIENL